MVGGIRANLELRFILHALDYVHCSPEEWLEGCFQELRPWMQQQRQPPGAPPSFAELFDGHSHRGHGLLCGHAGAHGNPGSRREACRYFFSDVALADPGPIGIGLHSGTRIVAAATCVSPVLATQTVFLTSHLV